MTRTTQKPPTNVFADYEAEAYPHVFSGELRVRSIAGGVPNDAKVAEGWLKSKLDSPDNIIREMVARTMVERAVDVQEATEIVNVETNVNGFKRNGSGLYIEGRQLKAAIKEAGCISAAAGKIPSGQAWGKTRKGIKSFLAEHVFVVEEELPIGADAPSRVEQSFVHTHRGDAVNYFEVVEDARIAFTVRTDQVLSDRDWAMIWLTGGQEGIGANRSQGYGRYTVTKWEPASSST